MGLAPTCVKPRGVDSDKSVQVGLNTVIKYAFVAKELIYNKTSPSVEAMSGHSGKEEGGVHSKPPKSETVPELVPDERDVEAGNPTGDSETPQQLLEDTKRQTELQSGGIDE